MYVGKGTGDRDLSHWSRGSHNKPLQDFMSHLRLAGLIAACERVFETDNEQEAFAKEMQLIQIYGRRDLKTGSLFNRTAGGEGPSGVVKTDAQKLVDKHGTELNWKKPEYRAKIVARQIEVQGTPEMRVLKSENTTKGWKNDETRRKRIQGIKASRTPELRTQISASCTALWDEERKQKQSEKMKEVLNSPERKAQRAAALKARWADPVQKAALLAARTKKSPVRE